MTTAATATMATVDAATITRDVYPRAECPKTYKLIGSRGRWRVPAQPTKNGQVGVKPDRSMPRTRSIPSA